MNAAPPPVFAFDEDDHLMRIHLKLGLENLGFVVREDVRTLALFDTNAPVPRPGERPPQARVDRG